MTCVVGIRGKRGVLLAGDSQASSLLTYRQRSDAKVFSLSDILAIAYCGSARLGQILSYELGDHLEDPPLGMDEHYWAVREFIPHLRNVAYNHGQLYDWFGVESLDQSAFLFAVRNRLFTIEEDLQVGEHFLVYEALGSGEDVAIGALHAQLGDQTEPISDSRLERLASIAITSASEFTNFVGGPIMTVKTTNYTQYERQIAKDVLA